MFLMYIKYKFLYIYSLSFETGIFCNIVHFFTVTLSMNVSLLTKVNHLNSFVHIFNSNTIIKH